MPAPALDDYREHSLAVRARAVMAAGNTRSTVFVPPFPPFAQFGSGARVTDQLGHQAIDCNNNYTALIHGHALSQILEAVTNVMGTGTAFGLPTSTEVALAEHLQGRTSIENWRFSNSGTEAVMTAIRGARALTGRDKILRFKGSYHGTSDTVVALDAPGIPASMGNAVVEVPQRDRGAYDAVLDRYGDEIAAVLIDLMPNRAGLVPADPEFVRHIRESTQSRGIKMIIDEVITFRLGLGGLHQSYGVVPDFVTLGKVVGGGFPVGAVGGPADVMAVFDPTKAGFVGWGGTFSANPVTMTAGLVALEQYDEAEVTRLNGLGDSLREGLTARGVSVNGRGSLCQIRESSIDTGMLWWRLYQDGVLAGTNGLLALSTPMTEEDVATIEECIVGVVSDMKVGMHDRAS